MQFFFHWWTGTLYIYIRRLVDSPQQAHVQLNINQTMKQLNTAIWWKQAYTITQIREPSIQFRVKCLQLDDSSSDHQTIRHTHIQFNNTYTHENVVFIFFLVTNYGTQSYLNINCCRASWILLKNHIITRLFIVRTIWVAASQMINTKQATSLFGIVCSTFCACVIVCYWVPMTRK